MDPIAEWTAAQARVIALVDGADPGTVVPACPAWTVRELLAHMIGLDADVVAGDEPDDHNSAWTQRQVDARTSSSLADLVAEWQALTGPLTAWMAANNGRPMGDVVIHEQDLRGALRQPGAHGTEALAFIRDGRLGGFPTGIRLQGDDWAHGPADAPVVVTASTFDLTRALLSRRSEAQLRAWTTRGDVTPFLTAFAGLGPLPGADLTES